MGGSSSGGGVESEGCWGALSSSDDSEEGARRLLKDVGRAEAVEVGGGSEKAGLVFDSGGLNKLLGAAPLERSDATKLKFCTPLPRPRVASPNINEAGFGAESLASSPWPTRSPENMPRVSPPVVFGSCGSVLKAVVVGVALAASFDVFGPKVGERLSRLEEVGFGVRENGCSPI